MKRILSVLLVALMLIGMLPMHAIHAHAAESTETMSIIANTGTLASDSSSISWTNGNITFTNKKGSTAIRTSDSDHYRLYAGSSVTIDAAGNITKIVVTCKSSSYATVFENSAGDEATASGSTVTIVPTASAASYTIASMTAQSRINAVEVTYTAGGSACEHADTTENSDGYAATCTAPGLTNSVTCNACGETVTAQEEIAALGHSYVDGTCETCGNVLPVVSFSVPSQVAAVDSITADENGVVALPAAADYTGKYVYTFVGWAEASLNEDVEAAPTLYSANSEYTPTADTTLYAVYTYTVAGTGGTTEYVLTDAANIKPGDTVVITTTKDNSTYYAMTNTNGTSSAPTAKAVTVSGDKLTADNDLSALKWDIGGSADAYIFYPADQTSTWLYCTSVNNGVRVGTNSANTFKIDASSGYLYHNGTGRYIGIYNNADWRCYTSVNSNITGQTLCFFVKTDGGTDYYTSTLEDVDSSCTHANTTQTTVDATCTDAGSVTVTCDDCGATVETTAIPATGHTEVADAAVDATCVATGLTAGSHCSDCNAVIIAQETVPATGVHTYVEGICSVCNAEEPTTGDVVYQLVTDASTLQAGDKIVIVAKYANYAMSATQSNNNRAAVSITKDSDTTVTFGDDVQIITLETGNVSGSFAFSTDEGYLYAASSSSNYLRCEDALSANSSWVITIADGAATVKAQGTNSRNWLRYNTSSSIFSCYSSGQSDIAIYKEVVLCEHENTENRDAVAPTCTTVGYTAGVYCTDCETYIEGHEVVAMIDHSYGEGVQTTAPGCTTTGVMTYTCTACGAEKTESIAATSHTMGEGVVVDATCEAAGSKTYTCTVCGEEQVETITAMGHAWDEGTVTTAATCDTAGVMTYTCERGCTKTEEIPALGHSYSFDGSQYVCANCGDTQDVICYELVTDYTQILAGGQFVIAAKSGDSYYALDTTLKSNPAAIAVETDGTGAETKVIYAEGVPVWTVEYYQNAEKSFSMYSGVSNAYLSYSGSGTGFSSSSTAYPWTFVDLDGDSVYGITDEDGGVSYVTVAGETINRAISYFASGESFSAYSTNGQQYGSVYFFKLVTEDADGYTVTFVENGTETSSVSYAKDTVIQMPQPTGAEMPDGYTEFVGWVTLPYAESLIAPEDIYYAYESDSDLKNTFQVTGDQTFYALYSRKDSDAEGQSMSYHLVTDESQLVLGENYIIVGVDETVDETTGEITGSTYYAMSQDQLDDYRGASVVVPDENGVITFVPNDKVAVFSLQQGYYIGSYGFLDLSKDLFLYCASSGDNNSLKSQGLLDEAASFDITISADGSYSILISKNGDTDMNRLLFNTDDHTIRLFSCYADNTLIDKTKTFLYVGVSNDVEATYYTTNLCLHEYEVTETVNASCTTAGYTIETCSICGAIRVDNVQAHGHNLGEATVVEATCTEAGSKTSVCQNADCGETFTYTMEYGVASYCYNMLNNQEVTDPELRTLLVDLLYYCDAARAYTTYKADESVTAALTEAQKAERTTADPELSSVLNAKYAVVENPKASWKSASLIMYHATRMRFRFETTADVSTLTVKAIVGTTEKEAYIQEEDGQYFVYVDDLSAFEMRETVYVTLYEGDTAVSNTVTYSIETYAYNKQNDADETLVELVKAMMRYGDSAIAYRN